MVDAPERIWAVFEAHESGKGHPRVYATALPSRGTEYVRADIAASQLAEAEQRNRYAAGELVELEQKLAEARAEAERWAAQALKEEECRIAWQAERDRLAADNARLREALEPFAQVAEYDIGENEGDGDIYRPMDAKYAVAGFPRVGDFRRARAALTGKE